MEKKMPPNLEQAGNEKLSPVRANKPTGVINTPTQIDGGVTPTAGAVTPTAPTAPPPTAPTTAAATAAAATAATAAATAASGTVTPTAAGTGTVTPTAAGTGTDTPTADTVSAASTIGTASVVDTVDGSISTGTDTSIITTDDTSTIDFLQPIIKEAAIRMIDLQDDWDSDGAKRIESSTIDKMKLFLYKNAVYFQPIQPEISPYYDGSIDIGFKDCTMEILINIHSNNENIDIEVIPIKNEGIKIERLYKWLPSLKDLQVSV